MWELHRDVNLTLGPCWNKCWEITERCRDSCLKFENWLYHSEKDRNGRRGMVERLRVEVGEISDKSSFTVEQELEVKERLLVQKLENVRNVSYCKQNQLLCVIYC